MPVSGVGAVGDGFDCEGFVVAGVEGELSGGFGRGLECVGAQGDAADTGALEAEGFVQGVGGARQEHGVVGGFGQGAAAAGGCLVGVADGAGQSLGDLVAGAQAGAEVVGQGEQGAPVLGGIEFVAGEGVFGADARRRGRGRGGGVDDGGVVSVGALVERTTGAGSEQALQCHRGDVGDVADGVQPVLGECGRGSRADAGQFADGTGLQERGDGFGRVLDDGPLAGRGEHGGHGGDQPVGGRPRPTAHSVQGERAQLDEFGDAAGVALDSLGVGEWCADRGSQKCSSTALPEG